jgi:hypothetical protein
MKKKKKKTGVDWHTISGDTIFKTSFFSLGFFFKKSLAGRPKAREHTKVRP